MSRKKTYCSLSGACKNTDCKHWVNLEQEFTQVVGFKNFKTEDCGFIFDKEYSSYVKLKGFIE